MRSSHSAGGIDVPHRLHIAGHLVRRLPAGNDGQDGGVAEREAQGRLGEAHLVGGADPVDPGDPVEDRGGRRLVIVERAGFRACRQDAGVEGSTDDDADLLVRAIGQERGERVLLQQRVAPGQEEQVEVGRVGRAPPPPAIR